MYPKTCANGYEFKLTILSINTQVQITVILEYGPAVELQRVKTQKMTLCNDHTNDIPDNWPTKITCLFSAYGHLFSILQVPRCIFQNLWFLEIPYVNRQFPETSSIFFAVLLYVRKVLKKRAHL